MVRSLAALLHRNPGFDARGLLAFGINLPDELYPKDEQLLRFDKQFRDRIRALPGIQDIASSTVVPLSGGENTIRFVIEGQSVAVGHENEANNRDVSSNYFTLMKIPLLAGRLFSDSYDSMNAPEHVIVNEAWVERYLDGQSALGRRIKFTYSPTQKYREIVGVVGNNAEAGLDSPDEPILFLPFRQSPDSLIDYIVRTSGNPAVATGGIRQALREVDPRLAVMQAMTMDQIIAESPSVFLRRYPSYLIGSLAALALILATVGLYGLVSYPIVQRTREIGIRMALGAQQQDVFRLILGHGLRLALVGLAVGTMAAIALTELMRSLLFGVGPADPATFAGVIFLLAVVTGAACYVPARRAVRTDPLVALR
jgi:macrolide transport system ATP-binding/permease protein